MQFLSAACVDYVGTESTNPKVPATSVQIICDDEVDAHFASPKSESCVENQQSSMRPSMYNTNDSKYEIQPIEGCITWGSKSSDNKTFDDFTSRWITDWPSLLWRYSKASATPIATLYLSVQPNTSGFFLLPILYWNGKKKLVS